MNITNEKVTLGLERKVYSSRENIRLNDEYEELCKELGLSTCHVNEALKSAFLTGKAFITSHKGLKNQKTLCIHSPIVCNTIHVQARIVREVLKRRRNKYEHYEPDQNPYLNFDIGSDHILSRGDLVEY